MNTLTQVIETVAAARRVKDEAKQNWASQKPAGSPAWAAARATFLTADAEYSLAAGELGKVLNELRESFCLEIVLNSLADDVRCQLSQLVADLRFDHLLAPNKPNGLAALAFAWRSSGQVFDAARAIDDCRLRADGKLDLELLRKEAESYRHPAAWNRAVTVCQLLLASIQDDAQDDPQERVADAIRAAVRHLRKAHDQLTEQMQVLVENLHYAGALSTELEELELDLRRYVQDALTSGLVRQRQTQTETKRKPQVQTAEPEAMTDEQRFSDEL